MRNTDRVRKDTWIWYSTAALVLAVVMMLFCNGLSIISNAAEGKVTGSSVRIRKEASTSSDVVGSATAGEILTINSEVQGSDGKVWYQINKGGVIGYIRSDYVQKAESTGGDTTLTVNPSVAVTEVNPVEGTIVNGSQVRVRTDASTETGKIITSVSNGTKVTVKGQADGTDGKVWYLVIFNGSNGAVEGFVRSDYVNVSGEITPVETVTPPEGEQPSTEEPSESQQPQEKKLYDTRLGDDEIWYLQDYSKTPGEEWDIAKLLEDYKTNAKELISEKSAVKTQKIVIIILVIFLIGAVLIATLLYFKIKDVTDDAYIAAIEKEALRERNAMKVKDPRAPVNNSRKVMQTVGSEGSKTARQPEGRPVGSKPVAQNPAGRSQTAPVKPANGQAKPVQNAGQPVRQPVKQPVGNQGRPVQKPGQPETPQKRPAGQPAPMPKQAVSTKADQNWKKNISDDDDEFEFEFLNWDGEEE